MFSGSGAGPLVRDRWGSESEGMDTEDSAPLGFGMNRGQCVPSNEHPKVMFGDVTCDPKVKQ